MLRLLETGGWYYEELRIVSPGPDRGQPVKRLGYLWAAPTTVACLMLFLLPMWVLSQVRPERWRDGAWEWLVVPGSGFERRWARESGWCGVTLGCCILFASDADALRLALHERRHVVQNLILGPLFMPLYALLWLAYGYERHPLERDARSAEDVV